jgi:transcriptional antiterminator RfaH
MPILAAEPDCFPDTLFDSNAATEDGLVWWVAHTRPRQEKCLARRLFAEQVPFYAPTAPKRNMVRGRVKLAYVPLFPGYVFLRATAVDRAWVRTTGRAASMLAVSDQERLWHDLRQVAKLMGTGRPVFPEDRIEPGALVQVRSGPLAGLTGTVVRSGSSRRFVVQVNFIQRGVAIEIEDLLLTRVLTC